MNHSPLSRRQIGAACSILLALGLSSLSGRITIAAEGTVPEPAHAFHPAVNSALYLDLAGIRQSGVWPSMAAQFKKLEGMFQGLNLDSPTLPGLDLKALDALEGFDSAWLKELGTLDFAELLVVGEGDLAATEFDQLGADDSFLLVARSVRPLEDQDAFVKGLLAGMDQVESGLGNRVAATRSRAGAAEVFTLPSELLGQQVPFPVSLSIGPGERGSVIALGRSDRLERFLSGNASGHVPARMTALMPRPGQAWLYSAIPADASKAMAAAGTPGLSDGPAAGILKAVDNLREFGLNLTFGRSAVDVQVLLGCTGSDVASQMAQQVSGMVGMLQMMSSGPALGFVSRLRANATGTVFALTTSVNPRDVDQLLQLAGFDNRAGVDGPAATGRGRVVMRPLEEVSPVEVEFLRLLPNQGGHLREARIRIRNQSDRAVRELRLSYDYLNARGTRVGTWTRQQRDPASDILVRPQATKELDVPLFNVPAAADRATVAVLEVVFVDGDKWTAPR